MFAMISPCRLIAVFFLLTSVLLTTGCARQGSHPYQAAVINAETGATAMAAVTSYTTEDFADIAIPVELFWDRDDSMTTRTESFAGGVLKYSGRVEIDSVTNFFIQELPKQGWKLVGSARFKKVLLAFTKPGKTCTIQVSESGFSKTTKVLIYVTDDIASRQAQGFRVPFGAETLK
jgi:hypothetical protein